MLLFSEIGKEETVEFSKWNPNSLSAWKKSECTAGTFSIGSTIGTTITAIEANSGTYCLQKRIEKYPLVAILISESMKLEMKTGLSLLCRSDSYFWILQFRDEHHFNTQVLFFTLQLGGIRYILVGILQLCWSGRISEHNISPWSKKDRKTDQ